MIITGPDGKEYRKITPGGNEEVINEIENKDNKEDSEPEFDSIKVSITRVDSAEKLKNILEDMLGGLISEDEEDDDTEGGQEPENIHINVGHVTRSTFVSSCNLGADPVKDDYIICIDNKFDESSFLEGMLHLENICMLDGIYKTSNYSKIRAFVGASYKDSKRPLEINYAKKSYLTFRKFKIDRFNFLYISNSKNTEKSEETFRKLTDLYKRSYDNLKIRNLYTIRIINDGLFGKDIAGRYYECETYISLDPNMMKKLAEVCGGEDTSFYKNALGNLFAKAALSSVNVEERISARLMNIENLIVNTFVDKAYMQTFTIKFEDLYENINKLISLVIEGKSEEGSDEE